MLPTSEAAAGAVGASVNADGEDRARRRAALVAKFAKQVAKSGLPEDQVAVIAAQAADRVVEGKGDYAEGGAAATAELPMTALLSAASAANAHAAAVRTVGADAGAASVYARAAVATDNGAASAAAAAAAAAAVDSAARADWTNNRSTNHTALTAVLAGPSPSAADVGASAAGFAPKSPQRQQQRQSSRQQTSQQQGPPCCRLCGTGGRVLHINSRGDGTSTRASDIISSCSGVGADLTLLRPCQCADASMLVHRRCLQLLRGVRASRRRGCCGRCVDSFECHQCSSRYRFARLDVAEWLAAPAGFAAVLGMVSAAATLTAGTCEQRNPARSVCCWLF
jgi:hypothetical protein